jgi:hypothetical protein
MTQHPQDERRAALMPPGRRWGRGAESVVPYLTNSLQSRPARGEEPVEPDQFIRNPVFVHMDHTLRTLRHRH